VDLGPADRPAIVAAFGAATALVALGFAFKRLSVLWFARIFFMMLALAGLLLAAFPRGDQPWLDALENAAPAVQEAFLTPGERATRRDSAESIAAGAPSSRACALRAGRALGSKQMDAERHERLRQYLAGRSELLAAISWC